MPKLVNFTFEVKQSDIAKIDKRLDKWSGSALKVRARKALQGGLALLVNPIRFGAARHTITGATVKSVQSKNIPLRSGEIASAAVRPHTWYAHFVIAGTNRGVTADPYVDTAAEEFGDEVKAYIENEVTKLE